MNELEFYNQQFDKYKHYDRNRSEKEKLNLENAEDYFEHLVRSFSDTENRLVDLGCGDGYFTAKLATFNGSVVGIEPSALINAANELLEQKKLSNLTFLKEDANKLSLDDESVELVISRRGPDPESEIVRILKQDGIFIFITIGEKDALPLKELVGRGQHFNTSEKVSDRLKCKFFNAGFTEVICKDFYYDDVFDSSESLKEFLHQVPIFDNFSSADYASFESYCRKYNAHKIKLNRHRVVLFARKS